MLGWRSGMLGLACLLLGATVLLFYSSGPKLVHLLLAKYKRFPLVVSSFFQNKQRSGHKEVKTILSEPEAQGVFYNLGKRFHGGKLRRKMERSPHWLEMKVVGSFSLEVIRS